MTLHNTNVDLVNDNVYTKFGKILYILSQDIEQKPKSDVNQGPYLGCKFGERKNNNKKPLFNLNVGLVKDSMVTKFG